MELVASLLPPPPHFQRRTVERFIVEVVGNFHANHASKRPNESLALAQSPRFDHVFRIGVAGFSHVLEQLEQLDEKMLLFDFLTLIHVECSSERLGVDDVAVAGDVMPLIAQTTMRCSIKLAACLSVLVFPAGRCRNEEEAMKVRMPETTIRTAFDLGRINDTLRGAEL